MGGGFVDDTNLYSYDLELKDSVVVFEEIQLSLYCWCDLLNSTGSATKLEKYFWYLVNYRYVEGIWEYTGTVDWVLHVPLPDGTGGPIKQNTLSVTGNAWSMCLSIRWRQQATLENL